MRVLITGSSGQIGTNLALRLQADGHEVFGVDKRQNTWTDAFPTLLQDLAGHYPAFAGGIGGVEYPEVDLVVHLAAHAKVHQLVREPHRALENAIMTFNVLEYARALSGCRSSSPRHARCTATSTASRSTPRRPPTSPSPRVRTRRRRSRARRSSTRTRAATGCTYLVFRFSNVYGRFDNDLWRMERVLPLFMHQLSRGEGVTVFGEDKVLDFTYIDDCVDGIARGVVALGGPAGREPDDQPRVRRGQHARARRRADRRRARRRAADHDRAVAARRGHALRRRRDEGAQRCSAGSPRRRSTRGSRRPSPGSRSGARRIRRRTGRSSGRAPASSSSMASSSRPAPAPEPRVLALFGPTASGKTAVAGILRERLGAEVVSADSAAVYAGLPILTAAPPYPAQLVGVVPLDREMSVGAYQRLAHEAVDSCRRVRSSSAAPASTSARRSPGLELPPPPAPGAPRLLAGRVRPPRRRGGARAARRAGPGCGRARARERPPARRARARARRGGRLARAGGRRTLDGGDAAADDDRRRSTCRSTSSTGGSRSGRARWPPRGAADEARRAFGGAAVRDRAQGARARGVRDAARGGGDRRGRRRHPPPGALPAKMAPAHARGRHARRHPASGGDRR